MSGHAAILVGRRPDGGHRDRLWEYCSARWHDTLGWPIFEGFHEGPDPFCFSVAINRAAEAASRELDWSVALYIGADWLAAEPEQARAAVALALRKGRLVFAHDKTVVLTADATDRMLNGEPLPAVWRAPGCEWHTNTFSGVVAVPRGLWDAVGGFDDRIEGWGFDDLCFFDACNAVGGGFDRVPGVIAHCWHPQPRELREDQPRHGANMVLWERYRAVKSDPAGMRALLSEPGGPLA